MPVGMPERAHPQNPLPMDIKPEASGNANHFQATMDLSLGWEGYYKKWVRSWHSPTPATLMIRDEFELVRGTGVQWYWQTTLPVTIRGSQIRISGQYGNVTLEIPDDCTARVDELPLVDAIQRRIAISKPGTSGTLEVRVTLEPDETASR